MNNLTTRLVAIHQPNFLPWLGYFGKLLKSDIFVFLDDAQIPKKGSSWSNRVRVLIGGRPQWITSPISREDGYQILKDVSFSEPTWQRTIEETYQKKTPLEHILLRPDTYVGSMEMEKSAKWILR
jgi:hypothetical protein